MTKNINIRITNNNNCEIVNKVIDKYLVEDI
jgi:hypothetical protein